MKPTVEDIRDVYLPKCEDLHTSVLRAFEEDQQFYELEFAGKLSIPTQFAADKVVLPTARDMVDAFVDHIDIANARVYVPRKGASKDALAEAEEMEKFYTGLIYMTNMESDISPWRDAAKHYALHGLAILKTVWDKDAQGSLPIVIQAVNPACIMPDPSYGGRMFVFEKHKKIVLDVSKRWPKWNNPEERGPGEEADYVTYWDKDFRCDLIDNEPVLKGEVVKHNYGFIPYVFINSGLGNLSYDAKPEMRYVGILRYIYDMLVSESLNYTECNILMKRETMKGGYITGADAEDVKNVKQEYGKYWPVGNKDVQFHDWETKLAPAAAYSHLALTHNYITGHAAPPSIRGEGDAGIRSGAHMRLAISEAASKYRYSEDAFKYRTAKVLTNCAKLFKNVIPKDVRVWSGVPNKEFDEIIKKDKMSEPFNCHVQFAPISEEDEYRRHDDIERQLSAGIITKTESRRQISNLDPAMMDREERKEQLRLSPAYAAFLDNIIMSKTQAASPPPPPTPPVAPGMPGQPLGGLVPPIPNKAQPGSAEEIQNKLKGMRSPTSTTQQGMGGGGARGATR